MENIKNFRIVNNSEKTIIIDSLSRISPKILKTLNKNQYKLYISLKNLSSKKNYPLIFLIGKTISEIIDKIEININSAGLYFGFIKNYKFNLSLEGAELLNRLGAFPETHRLFVDSDGEKSILYGNKISKKMITKLPSNLKNNDFLLIFNSLNEIIAIGISQIDSSIIQNLKLTDVIALNLIDKGYYLRRQ